jgi:hypothetical protein
MMKIPTCLLILFTICSPVLGEILINEVHLNPPGSPDTNYEYIELKSTTGGSASTSGLTIVLIDTKGGGSVGKIDEAWSLDTLDTGTNGLLILGNGYDSPVDGVWSDAYDPGTLGADPSSPTGMGDGDIGPNDAITILLVRDFTGTPNQDLETNGDGTLDITPWSAIVDSIGLNDKGKNPTFALANLTQATFNPDNVSRIEGNLTPNSKDAWYGGDITGELPGAFVYDKINKFGPFGSKATPGQRNQADVSQLSDILISEVNVDPPIVDDGNYEYIELMSASGQPVPADRFFLVLIDTKSDNDGPEPTPENPEPVQDLRGQIRKIWNLAGLSTGSNGLMLIGDDYPTEHPWGNFVDPGTALREPEGFGPGEVGKDDGFTLLLVSDLTGNKGDDLDTDDDGTLDSRPWGAVHDSIGYGEVDSNGNPLGISSYAKEFGGDVTQNYHIDNLSRKGGNVVANSAGAWYGGRYGGPAGGQSATNISYNERHFGGFRGGATPGRTNWSSEATRRPDSSILISEVSINPPDVFNQDISKFEDGQEFVEIISTSDGIDSLNGLHILIVGGDRNIGEVWDLSPMSTGTNGILLFGDSLDESVLHPDGFKPFFERETHIDDPDAVQKGDISPNRNSLILLVAGNQAIENSILDPANPPWTELVDSVGNFALAGLETADISQPDFNPDHVTRTLGQHDANDALAWTGGKFVADENGRGARGEVNYGSTWFGPFKGGSTPGSRNHAATASNAPILLSEVLVNPADSDSDSEFIELLGTAGAQSTVGYHLLLIDVGGGNTGKLIETWNLDGFATGENGLLLIGDGYDANTPPNTPYAIAPSTTAADPIGFDPGDLGGSGDSPRSNKRFSLLLVKNFSGKVGQDLDSDDNGFDANPPWTEIADSVGYREYVPLVPGDPDTGKNTGIIYALADVSQLLYEPDGFARRNSDLRQNDADAWYGGSVSATDLSFLAAESFGIESGRVTPGDANLPQGDGDGLPDLLERALGMKPDVRDNHIYPVRAGTAQVDGVEYLTFEYTRLPGGTGDTGVNYTAQGIIYAVESSTDLKNWDATGANIVVLDVTPEKLAEDYPAVQRVLLRHNETISTMGTLYFRLKVAE